MRFLPGSAVAAKLEDLRSLTDSDLASLAVDDFLVELLARTREILEADTAAVLVVDDTSRDLIPRVACGLEAEVRQGVRVPLGAGFAGRIAAQRGPMRLDRVNDSTVSNPILWETGLHVMLGVPLLVGDEAIGVLHVGRHQDRAFDDVDVELLEVVAERVAAAIQGERFAVERAAAELFERSLLPGKLPAVPGVEFAVRYVPAAGRLVGGDWYDAFTLPSGDLWIVIGDVAGHNLRAAVTMGRIKSAFRSFTLMGLPPHEVLRMVDRKIDLFEIDTTVTIACAVINPSVDSMQLAIAGHPPPIIASPDSEPTLADAAEHGPILGLGSDIERHSTHIPLVAGTTIVLYTDGLVERRNQSIDVRIEQLRAATFVGPARSVAHNVMRDLIGDTAPEDDIALLVCHISDR